MIVKASKVLLHAGTWQESVVCPSVLACIDLLLTLQKNNVSGGADIQQIMKEVDKDGNGRIGELWLLQKAPLTLRSSPEGSKYA